MAIRHAVFYKCFKTEGLSREIMHDYVISRLNDSAPLYILSD